MPCVDARGCTRSVAALDYPPILGQERRPMNRTRANFSVRAASLCLSAAMLALGSPAAADGAACAAAAPATDGEGAASTDSLLKNFYAGVGGGAAFENFDQDSGIVPRAQVETASGTLNLRAGYAAHPNLSAELMWEYYTGWDSRSGAPVAGTEGWSLTGNVRAYATRTRLRPFALFGMGVGHFKPDKRQTFCDIGSGGPSCSTFGGQTGFVARFGGGVEALVTESWVVGLETAYVVTAADLENLDYVTTDLVITYQFP